MPGGFCLKRNDQLLNLNSRGSWQLGIHNAADFTQKYAKRCKIMLCIEPWLHRLAVKCLQRQRKAQSGRKKTIYWVSLGEDKPKMVIHRSERIIECAVNAVQKIVDVSYILGSAPGSWWLRLSSFVQICGATERARRILFSCLPGIDIDLIDSGCDRQRERRHNHAVNKKKL